MKRVVRAKNLHPSWLTFVLMIGILVGSMLAVINRWNFVNSAAWYGFAATCMMFVYVFPKHTFAVIAFVAGLLIGLVRSASVLMHGENLPEQWDFVVSTRDWFAERIDSALPETESRLSMAYLLGIKDGLPGKLSDELKAVGLAHVVVASGAHLSILVGMVKKVFGRVSRFAVVFFSELLILLFMVMVGWTPSIMRAGIMTTLELLTWYIGRRFAPWRIILTTMTITILINPLYWTNLGWLLSFASLGGIMILGPMLTRFLYGKEKPNFVAGIILTTVAATLMTLPITLYYFGSISIIAVVANLLILPTLPYVMGLVFLTGLFAGVPGVGVAVGFVTEKLLQYHIAVVEFFAAQKYFIIEVPIGNPWVYILYIVVLAPFVAGVVIKRRKLRWKYFENMLK